ncbi:MAG: transcription antitermination factor NusB [Chloroflexi bacterium]|nr:transcription antitermination factor NusB [Chloroflexota bacterium]
MQVLYETDVTGHSPAIVLAQRLEETPLDVNLENFTRQIIFGVLSLVPSLDGFIAQHAPEWPLDQVAVIDRNILRIALWEFAIEGTTPIKVAINEAIELAKMFGSDSTPRFVNGVLGSLAARQNEIHQAFGPLRDDSSA